MISDNVRALLLWHDPKFLQEDDSKDVFQTLRQGTNDIKETYRIQDLKDNSKKMEKKKRKIQERQE